MELLRYLEQIIDETEQENNGRAAGLSYKIYNLLGTFLAHDLASAKTTDHRHILYSFLSSLIEQITGTIRLDMHGNTRPTRVPQRFQEREIAQAFLFLKSCFVDFEETIDALKKLPNDKFAVSAARALEMASENNIEVAKKYIAKLNEKIARQFKLADSQDEQTLSESQPPLSKMTKLQMRDSQNMKNKNFDMLDDELDRYCELGELCKTECKLTLCSIINIYFESKSA